MTISDHHRLTVGPSPIHGKGAFADEAIPAGDLVGTFRGRRTVVDGPHVLWVEGHDDRWWGIDGTGALRWLNHSCRPNVQFDGPDLFALRHIDAGSELVFDYGEEWRSEP